MFFILLACLSLARAQQPVVLPPGAANQLMVPQPLVEVASPDAITATAGFEPGLVRVGAKTYYRVAVEATENSILWPEKISAPPELDFGLNVRGQISRQEGARFRPLTVFLYEVSARTNGHFVVPAFAVEAAGRAVPVPAAALDVTAEPLEPPPLRRLGLEIAPTNLYAGQPFRLRVLLPVGSGNELEALREVQINGGSVMLDKLATRQMVESVNVAGQKRPAFVYETVATALAPGRSSLTAQAFTAGRDFGGPVSISGQVTISGGAPRYILLTSEPLPLNVRPLPDGELPGFTGAMGKFTPAPLQLSARRVKVGEPLQLRYGFPPATNLTHFVPPAAPRSRGWQIIAGKPGENLFTLIPLTDEVTNTPAIPFSAFDPDLGRFYDLTLHALPVTVVEEGLPDQLPGWGADKNNGAPLKLSALATTPGKTMADLKPMSWRSGLLLVMLPLCVFFMLWRWDERRRYLAAHPEIVRRQAARKALRRERSGLRRAASAADGAAFLRHAAAAMRVAVAPHFPADARALVGADVLAQLQPAERAGGAGETVRIIFAAEDKRFAASSAPPADWLALKTDVERLLEALEAKL